MSQNQFEDFLKNKTEAFSMEPDPGNWDKISGALPPEKKKRKAFLLWLPAIAASIIALLYFAESATVDSVSTNNSTNKSDIELTEKIHELAHNTNDTSISSESENVNTSVQKELAPLQSQEVSQTVSYDANEKNVKDKSKVRDDDSRFSKTCKRSVLNFPFLDPSVIHDAPKTVSFESNTPLEKEQLEVKEKSDENKQKLLTEKQLQSSDDTTLNSPKDTSKTNDNSKRKIKFFVSADAMPHFSTTRLGIESSYQTKEPFASDYQSRKSGDEGRVNACFGVGFGAQLGKHHSISVGLRYLGISFTMNVYNVDKSVISGNLTRFSNFDYESSDSFKSMNSYSQSTPIVSPPPAGPVTNKYSYIGIPIVYAFQFDLNNRWGIGLSTGATYNRLYKQTGIAHQKQSDIYVKSENGSVSSVTQSHFALQSGLYLSYNISKRSSLSIQLMGMRSLSPIEKDVVRTGYNSYGMSLGYKFVLGGGN